METGKFHRSCDIASIFIYDMYYFSAIVYVAKEKKLGKLLVIGRLTERLQYWMLVNADMRKNQIDPGVAYLDLAKVLTG